jgi:Glycosyl hydrolases family 2, TIM barrel domain
VERDYSHPSVVMWIPINESWGVPDLYDPRQAEHLKAMYRLTKSLDAMRPVIDNDGWEHTDLTDLMGIHDYAKTGEILVSKYKGVGGVGTHVPRNGREAMAPGFKYNGSPLFLSEFGGISYIAPGSNVPSDAWGYAGVEPNQEAAFARLKTLWDGLAQLPNIIGLCYTQLTDVEQEINGLLTYDRKLKFDPAKVKALNDMLR